MMLSTTGHLPWRCTTCSTATLQYSAQTSSAIALASVPVPTYAAHIQTPLPSPARHTLGTCTHDTSCLILLTRPSAPLSPPPPQQMTYVKQLENYEAAVMQKRLDEMTDTELDQMLADVDKGKEPKAGKQE
jgi:hypothetical protein